MSSPTIARRALPRNAPAAAIGWPLAPAPVDGAVGYPVLEASIRDQIKIILDTTPGELLLHPTFGAGLKRLLHEPNTLTTRRRIHDRITEALNLWEPRIDLGNVEVWEVEGRPDTVRVEIFYTITRTGEGAEFLFDMAFGS